MAAGNWIATDTWALNPGTDVYTGHVKAVGSGATLTELVYDITGNTGNLPQLLAANTNVAYNPSTMAVAPGTVIDISPLLNVLETRLRNNVVAAANFTPKQAAFWGKTSSPLNLSETGINAIFRRGAAPSPLPQVDCLLMQNIIMAEGVITTLKPGEYTKIGLSVTDFAINPFGGLAGNYATYYNPAAALNSLKPGDFTIFYNNVRYGLPAYHWKGMSGAENVIVTGPNSYYGWGLGPYAVGQTYAYWMKDLLTAFNTGLPYQLQIGPLGVPGYDQGNASRRPPSRPLSAASP